MVYGICMAYKREVGGGVACRILPNNTNTNSRAIVLHQSIGNFRQYAGGRGKWKDG